MIKHLFRNIKKASKHSILLVGILLFVFIFPLFEKSAIKDGLMTTSYTLMLLSVVSIVEFKRRWIINLILVTVFLQWVLFFIDYDQIPAIHYIAFLLSLVIFSYATARMIQQIIASKSIDTHLILATITGYLAIGVIFTMVNILVIYADPDAISFVTNGENLGDIIYYSFITMTTIGFGDIAPVTQVAKGFAVFFGLAGQLYLTIIMAFIIGKYLNTKES